MTIAQQPFNNIFRKPFPVRVWRADAFAVGIIQNNPDIVESEVMVSVQSVKDNKSRQLAERGIAGRDLKRLFGHVFLPMENEPLVAQKSGAPEPTDFIFVKDGTPYIADFYRPVFHGKEASGVPGQTPTCPAAQILIRGAWYEVIERIEMLNGVLSNFEYYVARVPNDEQV